MIQPMKYPGGKGACYQHLINLMPLHGTYIESHLGGGAVMRHKLPAGRNIGVELDARVVAQWRETSRDDIELIHGDAATFLATRTYTGDELVYCDPPYLKETRRGGTLYRHEYEVTDHERLLDVLATLPCSVMISGYDNALYGERLSRWRKHTFRTTSQKGLRDETVWMNFPTPAVLHDTRFLGDSFRERQTIQRRTQTLQRRVASMASQERAALIRWMSETFDQEFQEALCR